ncbi:alpha/beta hydrolase [Sporobolomyces salmoneus]|uniref:alpha/beta hydrolase n=1 Tax=Sporobolomyces salmoneus TaxID=183962 RepID=UPI00317E7EB3
MSTSSTADVLGPDGTKFFTKTWLPASSIRTRAVVLFVHGFVEHIRRYDHVFPLYAEKGIAVFAYDQRGFGQTAFYTPKHTQGQTTWPKQFSDIDFFASHVHSQLVQPGIPFYLMGHSMGGALVLGYHTRSPRPSNARLFNGVISTSPLLRQAPSVKAAPIIVKLGSILGKLAPNLPINAKVKAEDTCRDPEIQKAYAEDKLCKQQGSFGGVGSMLVGGEGIMSREYKEWDKELPVLVCHGESDKVTDCEASKEFVEKLKGLGVRDATYKGFEGHYHEMQNEPGQDKIVFINYVIDWILSHSDSNTNHDTSNLAPTTMAIDTSKNPSIQVSPASPIVVDESATRESKL